MTESRLNRRTFLGGAVAAGAALSMGVRAARAADTIGQPKAGKIGDFKISLAEWSLHNALQRKEITNLDFPALAREKYGVDGLEFVNQFFKDKAHDSVYLKDLKKRADHHGLTCVLIMVDGEPDLSAKKEADRVKAVDGHKKWVDAAAALGCHAIRVNTGSHYSASDVESVADGCGRLVDYAASHKISVICENHGGPSSDPDAMVALMKAVNKPGFGTLPDFGNFPTRKDDGSFTIDVYEAIAKLMPYAKGVSAKSHNFNPDGQETRLDYARIMKIVTDAGYKGFVGIEYEGSRLPEPEGIFATKKLLEAARGSEYKPA